ncbi:hypothetical protein BO83DRAFT_126551 [Aspergillus eucalypticola CBS 122712]|uniref:Uncharacterized protein n=1 Tax=Aspergillus eucalypticola (strain CBS 122712 / IBT 29274) TaxID=1448314 RepID=A0A317UV42_ASPEC|nr:uncharacterized protein BO83DRAFT_126551 [Aspergillus eucalypticola CBS 122712]PWY64898.1 hypothetical protein BO83DRAFT_126551 [Aspergillus eucalypticola CBS 122712]
MGAYRDPSAIGPSLLYNMRWASVLLGFQWHKIVGGPFHVTYKHIVTHQILHSLMSIIYFILLKRFAFVQTPCGGCVEKNGMQNMQTCPRFQKFSANSSAAAMLLRPGQQASQQAPSCSTGSIAN